MSKIEQNYNHNSVYCPTYGDAEAIHLNFHHANDEFQQFCSYATTLEA